MSTKLQRLFDERPCLDGFLEHTKRDKSLHKIFETIFFLKMRHVVRVDNIFMFA